MAGSYYDTPHWKSLRKQCLERDRYRCRVDGCRERAVVADHIVTRPRGVTVPTQYDVLSNLRSLCKTHDNQIKERGDGSRRRGGIARVVGCDETGFPLDPNHPWARQRGG